VLAAWVGLGYNRRARRLHEACVVIARAGWPRTAAALQALPGVGPYTAAAVASFAFGEQVAAVDTNVRRVLGRLGEGSPQSVLPAGRAASWNQALMDLGATICRAREARCDACPVRAHCASAGAVVHAPRAAAGTRTRFEDTNRFVRGRIVAALAAGAGLPEGIGDERLRTALDGLVRDGLVVDGAGGPRLAA
jgi:A/G-specific adenine glycosylase